MIPIPRAVWTAGLPNPSAGKDPAWMSDGVTRRPAISRPVDMLMVHYAGAPDGGAPGNQFVSMDSRAYMRNMFTWAFANGKGDEYSYCIAGPEGTCYEWAGTGRAAHCTNWNDRSIGVQFGLDVNDVPPLEYSVRLLELRRLLVDAGVLTADHYVDQHGEHFSTGCPGPLVKGRWPMYDRPLPAPPLPAPSPPAPPPLGVPVPYRICRDTPLYGGVMVVQLVGNDAVRLEPGAWEEHAADPNVPDNPDNLPAITWARLSERFTIVASPL
jgi:hypothetical protein